MKRTPLMLQVKPKIDYSVYAGVLIIIERSACGIRPVGVGFRTGRYNFITPFHMFSREKVDYGIASPENYDALLDEVYVAYLPSEVTKGVFMDSRGGPRSRTGHDQITVSTAEVVFCQAGVPVYKQGLSLGIKGQVRALGFALQCSQEWKPLVESFGEVCDSPSFTGRSSIRLTPKRAGAALLSSVRKLAGTKSSQCILRLDHPACPLTSPYLRQASRNSSYLRKTPSLR